MIADDHGILMGDWHADETGDLSSIYELPRDRRLSILAFWNTGPP